MVYHDDPYSDSGGTPTFHDHGVEIPQYRDETDDDREYGDIAAPPTVMKSSAGRCSRCKLLMALCFLAALSVGGWVYYDYKQGGGDGFGVKAFLPSKVGVRGSSSGSDDEGGEYSSGDSSSDLSAVSVSNDEEAEVPAAPRAEVPKDPAKAKAAKDKAKTPAAEPSKVKVPKEHAKAKAPAAESSPKVEVPKEHDKAKTHAAESPPKVEVPKEPADITAAKAHAARSPPTDECEDDATFVLPNLKTCATYIARVGRPKLHASRCASKVGIVDENGDEFELKDFCRHSCDNCDGDAATMQKQEYVEELEELEEEQEEEKEEEEEGAVDEIEEESDQGTADEGESSKGDADLWEELKEEEDEPQEKPTLSHEVEEIGDESIIDHGELPGEEVNEGAGSASEGKLHVTTANDEDTAPRPPPESHTSDGKEGNQLPDYFVPLTELERDALKEKLRKTLKETKDALVTVNALKTIPESARDMMKLKWQRTLVLSGSTPKEFMHLENDQTGSESIEKLIDCALNRQQEVQNELQGASIEYSVIREGDNVEMCMNELASRLGGTLIDNVIYRNDPDGNPILDPSLDPADENLDMPDDAWNACDTSESTVMTYSTSLSTVRTFGWLGVESISMFENPVERLHRAYRRTAKQCYRCQELSDVLTQIKNGSFGKEEGAEQSTAYSPSNSCAVQMIGHQAANLLNNPRLYNLAYDVTFQHEREIVNEAIRNLRQEITWIGVLDQPEDSVDAFKEIFPWLSENLSEAVKPLADELSKGGNLLGDVDFALPVGWIDEHQCVLEPDDIDSYSCGSKEIDEDALKLIEELNVRDLAVYKAALERFDLQQEVIREYREALHID